MRMRANRPVAELLAVVFLLGPLSAGAAPERAAQAAPERGILAPVLVADAGCAPCPDPAPCTSDGIACLAAPSCAPYVPSLSGLGLQARASVDRGPGEWTFPRETVVEGPTPPPRA